MSASKCKEEGKIRKITSFWVIVMVFISILTGITVFNTSYELVGKVSASTLYVNTSGSGGAYNSISGAIIAASDGDTIFVYSGTYNEELFITRSVDLIGEDPDTTIINGNGTDYVVNIVADNVKISGFKFISDKSYEGLVVETNNNTISNNKFGLNNAGESLVLIESHYNNITKNTFSSKNQWGIYLYNSSNNSITNNIISDIYAGIQLKESHSNHIAGNTISSNRYRSIDFLNSEKNGIIGNTISKNEWGMYIEHSKNCIVLFNDISDNKKGLTLRYSNGSYVEHNQILSNSDTGLRIVGSSYCDIDSNNISGDQIYGFNLHTSSFNLISSNEFHSNNWSNIHLYLSSSNTIIDNDITSSTWGIYMDSSENNSIMSNNISDCHAALLMFKQANHNVFTENDFFDNQNIKINDSHNNEFSFNNFEGSKGLDIDYSDNSRIFNNTIINGSGIETSYSNNSLIFNNTIILGIGIYFKYSFNSFIYNNYIMSNSQGIKLFSSKDNVLYHNIIINNVIQAEDNSDNGNKWDNDYSFGGNYWSDYSGLDRFKGSNQDIPGKDSIGDTHYAIDSNSSDRYPLIEMIPDELLPRIRLINPDNNSIIKVNSFVDLEIIDGNLDYVEYSVDNGEKHSLSDPFDISTQDWADGDHSIEIYAYDIYGNSNFTWFQITIDAIIPEIVSITPSDDSQNIPIDTSIVIQFSEPMNDASFEGHISFDPHISYITHWNDDRTELTISFLNEKPRQGTEYRLIIRSNATDINGNRIESDFKMEFTTEIDLYDLNNGIWVWIFLLIIIIVIIISIMFIIKKKRNRSYDELSESPDEDEPPPSE